MAANVRFRAAPGQRLNTADALRHAALAGDHERANHAGLVDVRAAAKLVAETVGLVPQDVDRADALAVLLAEQRHRALSPRRCEILPHRDDGHVRQDRLVDLMLDGVELIRREAGRG